MRKSVLKSVALACATSFLMTSCYTYTTVVGSGAQGSQEVKEWNHYLIGGLAPLEVSDSKAMAAGAENYTVKTEQSFVNGLVSAITFGLYAPTTTTVTK